jgi:phosphate:Na+ symporter
MTFDLSAMIGSLLGGIGLFLLGMWLMTDGLKRGAGDALHGVLQTGTGTPLRGLAAGFAITALVQSSTAVTVATIGFVNAGLLSLVQAIWVILGSNIGTTMTSWLVAAIGLKLKIELFALPLIGIGMLLRLTGSDQPRGAWGQALAGFGCFFAGIAALQQGFGTVAEAVDPAMLPSQGWAGRLLFVGLGVALTTLTQSSSAASAITVTAAMSGTLPLDAAAATVIGANLGTTSTALLAAIGATSNAKRSAVAHVLFNLVTAIVAFLLLPWLLAGIAHVTDEPALATALFHTLFNILGVALMGPAVPKLAAVLLGRFRSAEEDLARPRHLDPTAAVVPALALDSLRLELQRLGGIALGMARGEIPAPQRPGHRQAAASLATAIMDFALRLHRGDLPEAVARVLPGALRAAQHYHAIAAAEPEPESHPGAAGADFDMAWRAALQAADTTRPDFDLATAMQAGESCEAAYQRLKAGLLEATGPDLSAARLDRLLTAAATRRDLAERAVKAARRMAPLLAATMPA